MPSKKVRVKLTAIALVAFAALMSGLFVSQYLDKKKTIDVSQFHGTLLEEPRDVSHFQLTGTDQSEFTNANLRGQWTMVFFGFTSCGYLCPTTMAELGKMYQELQSNGVKQLPHVVMITIDPERDSLDKLKRYVTAFNPNFQGARGDDKTIHDMTQAYGIAYAKIALKPESGKPNYDMEHTGTIILFNPEGKLSAFFTTPHNAHLLAQDYTLLTA